ncbi:hypothetical protein [Caballeronia sp. LjRoot31]|uniref:hypothetical protein n=1 Tax=Caballeronia sp. LjRoot31 TaxID=3342324 RepID=UPI003ECDA19D
MNKLKVELVEDWRKALTWSCVRASLVLSALWLAMPQLLQLAIEHWPLVAPWVIRFFPSADASVVPAISSLLVILFRLTQIRVVPRGDQ